MYQDPDCPDAFIVQDKDGGKSYTYNIKQFQAPDATQADFIQGSEKGQTWVAYVNICGDAQVVGCKAATPLCQEDGTGKYVSMGTPTSWTMGPYFDPTKGTSSTPLYDKGVSVTTGGGDVCTGNSVARNAHLFLQCDPTATTRPTTVKILEADPSNPTVSTPCSYWFDPIPHASFCPGGGGGSGGFDYGWVFVIIVLVGLFLYFVLGIIILKFAMHKDGRDIVPHVDFWSGLPSLVIDGMKYTLCCVPCRGGGGYTEV